MQISLMPWHQQQPLSHRNSRISETAGLYASSSVRGTEVVVGRQLAFISQFQGEVSSGVLSLSYLAIDSHGVD